MPALRKQYRDGDNLSLDQPLGTSENLTLKDVIVKSRLARHACPNCRKRVKPGRTYCRNSCALVYAARRRRKVGPRELEILNKQRWLSRAEIASILGVTKAAINSAIYRHGLSRLLPDTCVMDGCESPAHHFKHCHGHMAGNLCLKHKREIGRAYQNKSRDSRRLRPRLTSEERKEHARKASLARWSNPKWVDMQVRAEFSREISKAKAKP